MEAQADDEPSDGGSGGSNKKADPGARISPKVARPKLPKFSSHTLGHHHRHHRTDPGKAEEIKHLMDEINEMKKWKDTSSLFDKTVRPRVIKPQTIPKARSTHTSPRTSPPPGAHANTRSSSLNRNRSRSLKLLTDKLKSKVTGGGGGQLSPGVSAGGHFKSKSADASSSDSPMFLDPYMNTGAERIPPAEYDLDDDAGQPDSIPEKDEREDEDKENLSVPVGGGGPQDPKSDPQSDSQSDPQDQACAGEAASYSDSDTPTTHVSTFTLHPIDRNSEFLRLRQTAPPKRRPGYAGVKLPKPKIQVLHRSPGEEGKDKDSADEGVKKPSKLELPGMGSFRKLSGVRLNSPMSRSLGDDGSDSDSSRMFKSPSTESPPPFPSGDYSPDGNGGSLPVQYGSGGSSPCDMKAFEPPVEEQAIASSAEDVTETTDEATTPVPDPEQPTEQPEADGKQEKRERGNGKSPKHKSKSDPSGNRTFDFDSVISSSQSHSFPVLGRDTADQDTLEHTAEHNRPAEPERSDSSEGPMALDSLNNNDGAMDLSVESIEEENEDEIEEEEEEGKPKASVSEDIHLLFAPEGDIPEPFEDAMTNSNEGEEFHDALNVPVSEIHEEEDGLSLDSSSLQSITSQSSAPATPMSYSPTGTATTEKQHHLSVPMPKRPILRSVSSASVFQRERKYSANSKDKEVRKHSLTTGDEVPAVPPETKTTEYLPVGDLGNVSASSMPSLNTERQVSDKRYHIVDELYRNETEYVEALKTLKESYMDKFKSESGLDERVVDNIFYMIPEILMHHQIYLEFLNQVWTRWNTETSTIGDIIQKTFSGQSVQDSYLSFVENYKTSEKVIENALQNKSSVIKFVENCQKESGSKLSLKDLIVRPIQRIPRYELLIQRLLDNTSGGHPDYALLKEAEKVMHEFARKIGTANETQIEDGQQETLKKLELLLMTDLAVPDRSYLRHDMVQILVRSLMSRQFPYSPFHHNSLSKKDQCCIWMFSDLIIISSVKRKGGPVPRKVSIILKSPTGQDFAENVKQKVWLRVGLDDIEVVKNQVTLKPPSTMDREQVEEDLDLLDMIQDLSSKFNCRHGALEDVMREMKDTLDKELSDHNERIMMLETNKMELQVTTQEGVLNLEIQFVSGEKRASWESTFLDAKQKLSLLSDKRPPEFLQPLQITKTRAGMQFSCAAPIDGFNASGYRDVWVCNSDGYVGHMCLLSLQPEPIVTLNTPVPGCNARILCIAAIPTFACLRRKSSAKRCKGHVSPVSDGPRISVEEVDSAITEEEPVTPETPSDAQGADTTEDEDGYQSDQSSSSDETDDDFISPRALFVEDDYPVKKRNPLSAIAQSSPDPIVTQGNWSQDPHKSTMWLGTEDGCIHIFQCTDNIKTTKNKLKIQLGYPVFCIVYLDNKVFVSLSNGDLIVYRRDVEGTWDTENPYTRAIGSVTAPIVKMLPVAGKLWCGRQNNIHVINPLSLSIETTFQVHANSNRCVQCIVNSGQGVWIASSQSAKIHLYHATSFDFLLEVSIASAVSQKLQSADDIIRQHKAACLRITSLLVCKDLLWIGTSAGVVLTIPTPKITSTTTRGSLTQPSVTGLVYGHTGHVRFLTCVELSNSSVPPLLQGSPTRMDSANNNTRASPEPHAMQQHRRSSVATMTATLATRMLVISGGDGYEDFRTNVVNEAAGKDDSTNHLLLWQV